MRTHSSPSLQDSLVQKSSSHRPLCWDIRKRSGKHDPDPAQPHCVICRWEKDFQCKVPGATLASVLPWRCRRLGLSFTHGTCHCMSELPMLSIYEQMCFAGSVWGESNVVFFLLFWEGTMFLFCEKWKHCRWASEGDARMHSSIASPWTALLWGTMALLMLWSMAGDITSLTSFSFSITKPSPLKGEAACWGAESDADPKEQTGAGCSLHVPSTCTRHFKKTALRSGNLPAMAAAEAHSAGGWGASSCQQCGPHVTSHLPAAHTCCVELPARPGCHSLARAGWMQFSNGPNHHRKALV